MRMGLGSCSVGVYYWVPPVYHVLRCLPEGSRAPLWSPDCLARGMRPRSLGGWGSADVRAGGCVPCSACVAPPQETRRNWRNVSPSVSGVAGAREGLFPSGLRDPGLRRGSGGCPCRPSCGLCHLHAAVAVGGRVPAVLAGSVPGPGSPIHLTQPWARAEPLTPASAPCAWLMGPPLRMQGLRVPFSWSLWSRPPPHRVRIPHLSQRVLGDRWHRRCPSTEGPDGPPSCGALSGSAISPKSPRAPELS